VIPRAFIIEWSSRVGWPTLEQVEQDLVLSRLIVEIANDPYLGDELAFRGGTCLHKLHLSPPARYSEDLDYVRRSAGGLASFTGAMTAIGERLGMEVRTQVAAQPKVYLRAPFESGSGVMRIKIEVNTHERFSSRTLIRPRYDVESQWFGSHANVQTFCAPELVATKLRALYQRSKGRDLFDLWLALTRLALAPTDIVECFAPYRPDRYTARLAELNLREKLQDHNFRNDLNPLVAQWPEDYEIDAAAEVVIGELFSLL
jgi:predicted nucleotidyltransferase component of viral defense system